ncbi:IS3 family transposase [Shigella flexneri 1c]|uniref:IS3-like element IS600 family transposase n=1 Tax=Shigella flexneri TaxID=623 RepID=UPI000B8CFB9F|nr:IS3-like element IS600 family transposase [Shigella flexneri]ATH67289.1 IS3 family transposase [Shigella flexneri 1c]AUU32502.1 transposase [Shigella flexneri]QKW75583.1 IS3 family transposase [Shigella flexneri]QKW75798.1 IS3 family transposase [Shigella flexneri]WKM61732.1 IS3-like element IS600 family transposase [Shigella flexneri 1b]
MSRKTQRYSKEFKAEAVRTVLENQLSISEGASRLSLPEGTLGQWVTAARKGLGTPGFRTVAELESEILQLRKALNEARLERDIFKKSNSVFCTGVAEKYALIEQWRQQFPIEAMCQVFGVSRSGYYNWVQHEPSDRKQSDERLKLEIKVAHIRTRETYGTRRLQTELAENGIIVGRDRLARLRKELRLRCKQKRKFRATTNPNHNLPVAPNLLNQTFAPTAPNQVWVADLTYVATQEGWLYLAGIKDVYTCEIVGYAMGERMTKELTGKALFMALRSQRPPAGLIHHSDRGSQYCAYDYRVIQEQFGLKTSMSRKGNCYDNAPMESFWGTLKNESLSHYRFNNRDEAISVIREYIEIFYNRQRRHSRLGNISPAAFREKYHQMAA